MQNKREELLQLIEEKKPTQSLRLLFEHFGTKMVFSSSFGMEDQVITHLILSNALGIPIFTLDTGRLFSETYATWNATNERYGVKIKPYYPKASLLEHYVAVNGPLSFYESPELRKECCHIRKVEPLSRALHQKKLWVTGLRAAQSQARVDLPILEWDETYQLFKFHPLLHWSDEEVKMYIRQHNIPYNVLHDKGFVSIGCAPCTRAIKEGEDFRAGRWWWESNSKKECGLHVHK